MANYKYISTEVRGGILTLTIDRPDKLNALNKATLEEIGEAFQEIYDDSEVKAVIVIGAGERAFVAGADIAEVSELNEVNGRKFAEVGQEVFASIEKCDKPVVAAVHGFALGGGCELAMACHIRIASESAVFGQPEVNLGLIPGFGGTQRLPNLIGRGRALEMMMTGDNISAERAYQIGLVNQLVKDKDALVDYCERLLRKITAKAPLAIGMVVDCVNAAYEAEEKGYQTEAYRDAARCKSRDPVEGTQAFLVPPPPPYTGAQQVAISFNVLPERSYPMQSM